MKMLDPTYLRTIYDGLQLGSLNKDNVAALPTGLVGLYEESLPPASNVIERKKFLEFFAVWSLLKKEVSASFVRQLLGWAEVQTMDYIARYSKWFNSPTSGKYVLYHERLRSFVLQKISHAHFTASNETIIRLGQKALANRGGDEWEQYALEYLSTHLLIQAMETENPVALRALAYNTAHWNRQVEISKGFEWSKRMLNDMMLWASKYDEDEVIECALNKIDLHHQEQNDAPRIVALVALNDMDTALQRIEAFGGNDQEGLQRKFILYMLCLLELTLLESKDKPFRKEAIEKLLKHLDDNLPVDHSVLNWNDFFPSYLMFLMACDWAELGCEYQIIYKRTYNWETEWLNSKAFVLNLNFQVLKDINLYILDESDRSVTMEAITILLAKQGKTKEASEYAKGIIDDSIKKRALYCISIEMAKQGKSKEALAIARGLNDYGYKCGALIYISDLLYNEGKVEESAFVIQEALTNTSGISDGYEKGSRLMGIYAEMAKQGMVEEATSAIKGALMCARGIIDEFWKISMLNKIAAELAKQSKTEYAASVIQEAIECALGMIDDQNKSSVMMDISTELAKLGKLEEAFKCARGIIDDLYKIRALKDISYELAKQSKTDDAATVIQEALEFTRGMIDGRDKSNAMELISYGLAKQGNVEDALTCVRNICDKEIKSNALQAIFTELNKQGKVEEAGAVMQEALESAREIHDDRVQQWELVRIAKGYAEQGRVLESAMVIGETLKSRNINYDVFRIISTVSFELASQGNIEKSLKLVRFMPDNLQKVSVLTHLSVEMAKQGLHEIALQVTHEAIECTTRIEVQSDKSLALKDISLGLVKQGKIEGALDIAEQINSEISFKDKTFLNLANELASQGKLDEALVCMKRIQEESERSFVLRIISSELAKQGEIEVALAHARRNLDDYNKCLALLDISAELAVKGFINEAEIVLNEALGSVTGISDMVSKISALCQIYKVIAAQGNIIEASNVIQEAVSVNECLPDEWDKNLGLLIIASALAEEGEMEKAKEFIHAISDEIDEATAMTKITSILAKEGKIEAAIQCAQEINYDYDASIAISGICIELAKIGNWPLAEKISMDIPEIGERNICWNTIATDAYKDKGWKYAIRQLEQIQSKEIKAYFLKGLAEIIDLIDTNKALIINANKYYSSDTESMQTLMQQYALHELFLQSPSTQRIERFNRTLNIQWAIDIKNFIEE